VYRRLVLQECGLDLAAGLREVDADDLGADAAAGAADVEGGGGHGVLPFGGV
jgi:hypothetical protein